MQKSIIVFLIVFSSFAISQQEQKHIEFLIESLKSKNKKTKRYAAIALGEVGPDATPAITALTNGLYDEDLQYSAKWALIKIGKKAVPVLIHMLRKNDFNIERALEKALAGIGKDALSFLLEALKKEEPKVKLSIIKILGEIGERSSALPLIELVSDGNYSIKKQAIEALEKIKPPQAIPILIKTLKDNDPWIRSRAAKALGEIKAKEAVPHLIKILSFKDVSAIAAAEALGKIGKPAVAAVPSLIKLFEMVHSKKEIFARGKIIYALGSIGESSPMVIKALVKTLEQRDAIWILARMGEKPVPYLIEILQKKGFLKRKYAFKTIRIIGKNATQAIKPAISLFKEKDIFFKEKAVQFLAHMGKKAIPYLIENIESQNLQVKKYTMKTLAQMGKLALSAKPYAFKNLGNADTDIRNYAIAILSNFQEKKVFPYVVKMLESKNAEQRLFAVKMIGNFGDKAIPYLIKALYDENYRINKYAAIILKSLGVNLPLIELLKEKNEARNYAIEILMTTATSAMLISKFKDKNVIVRQSIAKIFWGFRKAHQAIPHLFGALNDTDAVVRKYSILALLQISKRNKLPISYLVGALKNKDPFVKENLAKILAHNQNISLRYFIPMLRDRNPNVRRTVVQGLGKLGEKASIPYLIPMLRDKDMFVRLQVGQSLGEIGVDMDTYITMPEVIDMEHFIKGVNNRVWKLYKKEKYKEIKYWEIKLLEKSDREYILNTVATIYAWQKKKVQAYYFSLKAQYRTSRRVTLLLRGKRPAEVEAILNARTTE